MVETGQDVQRFALGVLRSRLLDSHQLIEEFRSVVERDPTIRHTQSAAHASANQNKNRYSNVLPYDHNRVLLRPCSCGGATSTVQNSILPSGHSAASSCSDYINASDVVHQDELGGFALRYIASQGPLPCTVADFWHMCWSEGVGAIVMLTNIFERGINKCSAYYPVRLGDGMTFPYGGKTANAAAGMACVQEVVAVSSSALHRGDLTHTVLRMVCRHTSRNSNAVTASVPAAAVATRDVEHFHYTAWPDHGTPEEADAIRRICDMVEHVRAAGRAIVVHCSAGIGRTGTFCAIDILRRRLACLQVSAETRPGSVPPHVIQAALDLPELVHSLRRQRCGMVQTVEQYMLCYQAVYEELEEALGSGGSGAVSRGGGGGNSPRIAVRR